MNAEIESPFSLALTTAARLPGVRIDRERFLRGALKRNCSAEQLEIAIRDTPTAAGIPLEVLSRAADASINYETAKVTGVSAVAGIPGGFALIGTIPADSAQYFAHILRIAQKLSYLYSWPDLLSDEGEDLDDATRGLLTLFVGVMFGAQTANAAVSKVSVMMSEQVIRRLPQQALTKGVLYPVVKTVAQHLGVQMTKQVFAKGVAKVIPVLGGVVSGAFTLGTFLPMAKRLKSHLHGLESARPQEPEAESESESESVIIAEGSGVLI